MRANRTRAAEPVLRRPVREADRHLARRFLEEARPLLGDAAYAGLLRVCGPPRLLVGIVMIPLPSKKTHPNARAHRRAKIDAITVQRGDAFFAAKHDAPNVREATYFEITAVLERAMDPDNVVAWLKASIDGLRDAGVICEDSKVEFDWPLVRKPNPGEKPHVEFALFTDEPQVAAVQGPPSAANK